MEFNLKLTLNMLRRTPGVLEQMLDGMPEDLIRANEGGETWSPFDIVGHLIHGERTDWIPRMEIILATAGDKKFKPFDRFAQFDESEGKSLSELLSTFRDLRLYNTGILESTDLSGPQLAKQGIHPAFGKVSLRELLAAWTVHDLNHIGQISRILAFQYKSAIGPWTAYMGILHWASSSQP